MLAARHPSKAIRLNAPAVASIASPVAQKRNPKRYRNTRSPEVTEPEAPRAGFPKEIHTASCAFLSLRNITSTETNPTSQNDMKIMMLIKS